MKQLGLSEEFSNAFEVNIFDFDELNTWILWIINVICIIIVELALG